MDLTFRIPDDLASQMERNGSDLSRRALEGLALAIYSHGHTIEPELLRLLDFETRYELDGFLKAHGVYEDLTVEDVERDVADLKSAGF